MAYYDSLGHLISMVVKYLIMIGQRLQLCNNMDAKKTFSIRSRMHHIRTTMVIIETYVCAVCFLADGKKLYIKDNWSTRPTLGKSFRKIYRNISVFYLVSPEYAVLREIETNFALLHGTIIVIFLSSDWFSVYVDTHIWFNIILAIPCKALVCKEQLIIVDQCI